MPGHQATMHSRCGDWCFPVVGSFVEDASTFRIWHCSRKDARSWQLKVMIVGRMFFLRCMHKCRATRRVQPQTQKKMSGQTFQIAGHSPQTVLLLDKLCPTDQIPNHPNPNVRTQETVTFPDTRSIGCLRETRMSRTGVVTHAPSRSMNPSS